MISQKRQNISKVFLEKENKIGYIAVSLKELKSIDAIDLHSWFDSIPLFEDFAKHYRFNLKVCRPYCAKTKGKVDLFNYLLRPI